MNDRGAREAGHRRALSGLRLIQPTPEQAARALANDVIPFLDIVPSGDRVGVPVRPPKSDRAWGWLVAVGMFLGLWLGRRRAE